MAYPKYREMSPGTRKALFWAQVLVRNFRSKKARRGLIDAVEEHNEEYADEQFANFKKALSEALSEGE